METVVGMKPIGDILIVEKQLANGFSYSQSVRHLVSMLSFRL
jgi:hypothetical protein